MRFFLSAIFIFVFFAPVKAQLNNAAFPFYIQNTNIKSLSLGNATVSLGNEYGDSNINPAGIGLKKNLQFFGAFDEFGISNSIEFIELNFGFRKSALGLSYRGYDSGERYNSIIWDKLGRYNSNEIYLKAIYSVEITRLTKLGIAINYMSSEESQENQRYYPYDYVKRDAQAISFDLGFRYEKRFQIYEIYQLSVRLGSSVTNLGYGVDYYRGIKLGLPGSIRNGAGITFHTNKLIFGQELASITLLGSVSKLIVANAYRKKQNGIFAIVFGGNSPIGQLASLFNEVDYLDGGVTKSAKLLDQLWFQSGIELKLLNTLSVRLGREKAGKPEEILSYNSLGVGISFFYVDFDYMYAKFDNEYKYSQKEYLYGSHWQITGRIPLNGEKPKTILNHLLK